MNMIVCIKQVVDPEAPPASFKIDPAGNKMVTPPGVSPVVDPYSEYAVEAALRIKDAVGGKITIMSLGANLLPEVVKKPLAMGADELILLEDGALAEGDRLVNSLCPGYGYQEAGRL
jgi:electron transfer flavoprotein beta subunit